MDGCLELVDCEDVGIYNHLVYAPHLLIVTGQHGIIQNLTKYQFGKLDFGFIRFIVSIDGIRPAPQIGTQAFCWFIWDSLGN